MNRTITTGLGSLLGGLLSLTAAAEISVNTSGFIRQEMSVLQGNRSPYNQPYGNIFNQRTVSNTLGTPITRSAAHSENDWNLFATRAELDFKLRFNNNWEGFAKLRGFYEWRLDKQFDNVEMFDSSFNGGRGNTLEANGEQYAIDIPSLYLDYNKGPLWLRIGSQQIAWGEGIFFRVFDVPNGLDLRRHSFLDVAAEEYADKRVPALGIRGSYRFDNDWELEAYAQQFRPSVLPPPNSPYNFIASQFVIDQRSGWTARDEEINFGAKLSGRVGDVDLQFMYTRRHNPDGTFRWTESGINPFAGSGNPALEGLGALLSRTPFEQSPGGVWTAREWFEYAGLTRLDGIAGLNASIRDFPAAQALGAFEVNEANCRARLNTSDLRQCAFTQLDVFYDTVAGPALGGGLGPLKGHLVREYHEEDILGFGFNYVFQGEPDSLLDQLVLRTEFTYAFDRKFTNIGLDREPIEEDEFVSNIALEKYHRFSAAFPATYFVLQWMHKSESDLLGRHVSGLNNPDGEARGEDSFNALAIALQQPFPGLIWRADLSILYDVKGGYLLQPGVKWRPNKNVQLDIYYNHFASDGGNKDLMQTFENQEEFFARFTYYF